MSLKNLITSTCMAVFLSGSICFPASARHVVNDPAANVMDAMILIQDLGAVILKTADLAEFIKRNISFGNLGAISSSLDYSKNIRNLSDKLGVPKLEGVSKEIESKFNAATKDAAQMKNVVKDILPSASKDSELTDKQKAENKKAREAIRNEAVADAYAVAVAYQNKKTAAAAEVVNPAQSKAAGAETQQEKQAAANDIGLARLNELVENNLLTASLLKLQAAEAMGNLPVDF